MGDDAFWRSYWMRDGPDADDVFSISVQSLSGTMGSFEIPAYQTVHNLKEEIESRLRVTGAHQAILAGDQKLRSMQKLSKVFGLPGRTLSVTLLVTPPKCNKCSLSNGLFGPTVMPFRCMLCLDTFYCSSECRAADKQSHHCVCG